MSDRPTCIRWQCDHAAIHHGDPDVGEYPACASTGADGAACECEGFQSEPTEAQLRSLYDVNRKTVSEWIEQEANLHEQLH